MKLKELDQTYIAGTYARFPLTLIKGEGACVTDDAGKTYIDLTGGIAVNTFGFADAIWAEAIAKQAQTLQHTSNLFYTEPCILLAQQLCERSGMKKVFFSNSGAEANECLIKTARKYAAQKNGASSILTLENSFHGRTLATLAATGQEKKHKDFQPLPEGFVYAKAGDLAGVEQQLQTGTIAAILIELVQGEGGVNPLSQEFVSGLAALAKQYDVLLCDDEVQIGNGRSGSLYAYMEYGIVPDIVSTAKGLGGGLPIGATLFGEKTADVLQAGDHGSTFGGNPVACAGALSILSRLTPEFLAEVREKSSFLFAALEAAPGIKNLTGLGLMLGFETEKPVDEVIAQCREQGVLLLKAKTKVRLLPPLNIPQTLLAQAVETIKAAAK